MSLVVFPFKDESVDVVATNLGTAVRHDRIDEVWAVAAAENAAASGIREAASEIEAAHGKPVRVFAQNRVGELRSGKGDGMNTAIALAAERDFDRIHFYDADITNFDESWIDGAESAADRGYGVVRHRFPRAATDAMITWMIARPGLAKLFPGTLLPRLGQPLGGELLLVKPAIDRLANDPFVIARSDWGIDIVITHATATSGLGVYEHNVTDGKRHALYGSLTDIREMILECLDAVASLKGRPSPPRDSVFAADPPADVPADLKETVGYDIVATQKAIADAPTPAELAVIESLDLDGVPDEIDAGLWGALLDELLARFDLADDAWRSAVFRLWVIRVITYTINHVSRGYDHAMSHLEEMIRRYEVV